MSPKVHKILGSVLLLLAMSNLYLYSLLLKHKQWFLDPSIPYYQLFLNPSISLLLKKAMISYSSDEDNNYYLAGHPPKL